MANGRCAQHGGKSLSGAAHPRWKGGVTKSGIAKPGSRLPPRLRKLFDDAMADPELLSVRSSVAFVQARISELEERLHSGEAGSLWKSLGEHWAELQAAQRDSKAAVEAGDEVAQMRARSASAAALAAIGKVIGAGVKDELVWREMRELQQERAVLARSEMSIIKGRAGVMTDVEIAGLVDALHASVMTALETHVKDEGVKRVVLNEVGLGLQRLILGRAQERQAVVEGLATGEGVPPGVAGAGGQVIDVTPAAAADESGNPPHPPDA